MLTADFIYMNAYQSYLQSKVGLGVDKKGGARRFPQTAEYRIFPRPLEAMSYTMSGVHNKNIPKMLMIYHHWDGVAPTVSLGASNGS